MVTVGLSGASGTGKTTVVKQVSKMLKIEYVGSVAAEVFRSLNMDAKIDYPFETRLFLQEEILKRTLVEYEARRGSNTPFVTDRTPIDFAASLMADVGRQNLNEELTELSLKYVEKCVAATNLYIPKLIVIQPGIKIEDRDQRPTNKAYGEHINSLIIGILTTHNVVSKKQVIGRRILDLNRRVKIVCQAVSDEAIKHPGKLILH